MQNSISFDILSTNIRKLAWAFVCEWLEAVLTLTVRDVNISIWRHR
jgi:hypothetical protein